MKINPWQKLLLVSCAGTFLAFFANPAVAAIVFNNGGPASDPFNVFDVAAVASDIDAPGQFQAADDFSFSSGTSVTDAHWFGFYAVGDLQPPSQDNFTLRIFADASGSPANASPLFEVALGAVARTDTGLNALGFDIYEYSALYAPINLSANTTYWFSILNDTTGEDDNWFWSVSSQTGNAHFRAPLVPSNANWLSNDVEMAFQLTDDAQAAVPEPSALALWAVGLGYAACFARRRRVATS